MTALIYFLV